MTWSTDLVRKTFLEYFQSNQHQIVKSCPVVINDPTLLFVNAGMNPFKPYFLGLQSPTNPRITDAQKCIRAGGKHNDLEDVGADSYHHTFFEMMGNWSIGDYFKKEAIDMAWDLLTNHFHLDPNRLYITIYEGDDKVPKDQEAIEYWLKHVPNERILHFDAKDNFWEMGATGPCGPCTEIHYDLLGNRDAASLVNMDDPTVIEIWNIVFIQYDRQSDGSLKSLPNKHIDTGMGLERVSCILQNKTSNYDIDIFQSLFSAIQSKCNVAAYSGSFDNDLDKAYRVVADHLRTLCFAIGDQVLPSNEGRGYVLRRILRRGINYARLFNAPNIFSLLCDDLIQLYPSYPELLENRDLIYNTLLEEENAFKKTLDRGLRLFHRKSPNITPKDAFQLYDTYGFPFDLTQILAKEHGFEIDEAAFQVEADSAKERSKQQGKEDHSIQLTTHHLAELASLDVPPTVDHYKYTDLVLQTEIVKVFHTELVDQYQGTDTVGLLLKETCCYGESGGQVGDRGTISNDTMHFTITDTKRYNQYTLHIGYTNDSVELGPCTVEVDHIRQDITRHHTATHVLNEALRLVSNGDQKGSLVTHDKLRFDFSHPKALDVTELEQIEAHCQSQIEQNLAVYDKELPLVTAKMISGIRAVFGEQYPDPVRVVCIGESLDTIEKDPQNEAWKQYSIELCGGTHVGHLNELKSFLILDSSAIAKGVRRLVCVVGDVSKYKNAYRQLNSRLETLPKEALNAFKADIDGSEMGYLDRMALRQAYEARKKQQLEDMKKVQKAQLEALKAAIDAFMATDAPLFVYQTELKDKKQLSQAMQPFKKERGGVVFSKQGDAIQFLMQLSSSFDGDAKVLMAPVVDTLKGKMGGKKDMCQGQGTGDQDTLDACIAALKQ